MAQTASTRTRAKKPSASATKRPAAARRSSTRRIDRTVEMSDEVLKSVEAGERAAIDALRKIVDTVDRTLPPYGGKRPTRRSEILDSAINRADRLVDAQHDLIRRLIDSTARSAGRREVEKADVAKAEKADVAKADKADIAT